MFSEAKARRVTQFIQCLRHTKGEFHGQPFKLLPWQEKVVRDVFGTVRDDDPTMRQYNTAYIEIPKKNGKSELGAAIALNMLCNDDEWRAEVYSCASDRQQAAIVFDVAVDMVKQSPALSRRIKIIPSITSSNGTIFKNTDVSTTLTAHVYKAGVELNATQIAALGTIKWYKDGSSTAMSTTGPTLNITPSDVTNKASYIAQLEG